MFTGIVSAIGAVVAASERNDVRRLAIACDYPVEGIDLGASILCSGICMTVISRDAAAGQTVIEFEAGPETLAATNVRSWEVGRRINLERALKIGDELGGHMVSGHVDGLAGIVARDDFGETTRFRFEVPDSLARYIAPKGSVALDGTSLTVNQVEAAQFDCMLIPHTLKVTTWNERKVGEKVNLEVDQIARYVARLMAAA
jgi:riboflavin synthase